MDFSSTFFLCLFTIFNLGIINPLTKVNRGKTPMMIAEIILLVQQNQAPSLCGDPH